MEVIKILKQLYKTFQDWSAKGSVWVYSDPHFGDSDCKIMDPNWITPEEQVKKINDKVKKGDTLILLGDIGNLEYVKRIKAGYKILISGNHDVGLTNYKKTVTHEIKEIFAECVDEEKYEIDVAIERKSFHKYLYEKYPYAKINIQERYEFHSPFHFFDATIDDNLFDEVYGGPLFIGEKILLSHEPIYNECWYNIHGHRHSDDNTNYKGKNYFNCCANVIKYEPINLKDIIKSGALKNIPTIHRKTIDIVSSK